MTTRSLGQTGSLTVSAVGLGLAGTLAARRLGGFGTYDLEHRPLLAAARSRRPLGTAQREGSKRSQRSVNVEIAETSTTGTRGSSA